MPNQLPIYTLWLSALALLSIGLSMVASTGPCAHLPGMDASSLLQKQCIFAAVGLLSAIAVSVFDVRKGRRWVWLAWGLCCALLTLCFVPGVGLELNGESRWIRLPGITFQPSEVAKLIMVISLAHWYSTHRETAGTFWKGFALPGVLFAIPLGLIFIEKDMGTAAALGLTGFCIMLLAGARWWLLLLAAIIGFMVLYGFTLESENRLERILAWLNPEAYSLGSGRQQWIAARCMMLGGWSGVGLGEGFQKFGNLAFAYTDFIYGAIGEELGLQGTGGVLVLFTAWGLAGCWLIRSITDTFSRLTIAGLVCSIFWPAILNMMVVTSLLPNSGLPLPFISCGGTNLVFTLFSLGIITSLQRHHSNSKRLLS